MKNEKKTRFYELFKNCSPKSDICSTKLRKVIYFYFVLRALIKPPRWQQMSYVLVLGGWKKTHTHTHTQIRSKIQRSQVSARCIFCKCVRTGNYQFVRPGTIRTPWTEAVGHASSSVGGSANEFRSTGIVRTADDHRATGRFFRSFEERVIDSERSEEVVSSTITCVFVFFCFNEHK